MTKGQTGDTLPRNRRRERALPLRAIGSQPEPCARRNPSSRTMSSWSDCCCHRAARSGVRACRRIRRRAAGDRRGDWRPLPARGRAGASSPSKPTGASTRSNRPRWRSTGHRTRRSTSYRAALGRHGLRGHPVAAVPRDVPDRVRRPGADLHVRDARGPGADLVVRGRGRPAGPAVRRRSTAMLGADLPRALTGPKT